MKKILVGVCSLCLGVWMGYAAGVNLLPNGDFEKANPSDPRRPWHWDLPDGLGVQWLTAPGTGHGKAIRMNTAISERDMVAQWRKMGLSQWDIPNPAGNAIADTYGLSFYSDAIPVKSGMAYRVSFDFKGHSGGGKLWVRGWGMFEGERRRRWETIVFCRSKGNEWTHFEQDFHPTKHRPEVTEMKVMLYSYHPAGEYWFDNVKIEPIAP
jgi:hypothetical protein